MDAPERLAHNQYQRTYFDTVERSRIAPGASPYITAHAEKMLSTLPIQEGQKVLEVGAGLGKFTRVMAGQGWDIVANDLSPVLLERLRAASDNAIETLCCDISEAPAHVDDRFDHAMGFFVLHHLKDFDAVFNGLAGVLKPGATVAFCEPVAWNPLYYAQILFTPGMTFAGEPSMTSMRPGVILPALERAGFIKARSERYGYFPPQLKNHPAGHRLEAWLNGRTWVPFPNAFQIFSAQWPG